MIVGSFPIQDPHPEKRQQGWIVDFGPIHHLKPLSSPDHVGPKLIVEEEIRKHIIPPLMVGSLRVFPLLDNPMEGVLGNLENPPQCFFKQK